MPTDFDTPKQTAPLLVSAARARQIIGVGNTKFWQMVKSGRIKMADVGGRRMVVFASLEALTQPAATIGARQRAA
jgi:hypothetical protein